jgi:hypothetical protein
LLKKRRVNFSASDKTNFFEGFGVGFVLAFSSSIAGVPVKNNYNSNFIEEVDRFD